MFFQAFHSVKQSLLMVFLSICAIALTACGGGGGGGGGGGAADNVAIDFPAANANLDNASQAFQVRAINGGNIGSVVVKLNGVDVQSLFATSGTVRTSAAAGLVPFLNEGTNTLTAQIGNGILKTVQFNFSLTPDPIINTTGTNASTLAGFVRQAVLNAVMYDAAGVALSNGGRNFSGAIPGGNTFSVKVDGTNGKSVTQNFIKPDQFINDGLAVQLNEAGFNVFEGWIKDLIVALPARVQTEFAKPIGQRTPIFNVDTSNGGPSPQNVNLLCQLLVGGTINGQTFGSIFPGGNFGTSQTASACEMYLDELALNSNSVSVNLEVDDNYVPPIIAPNSSYGFVATIELGNIDATFSIAQVAWDTVNNRRLNNVGDNGVLGQFQIETSVGGGAGNVGQPGVTIIMKLILEVGQGGRVLAIRLPASSTNNGKTVSNALTLDYTRAPSLNGHYCNFPADACGRTQDDPNARKLKQDGGTRFQNHVPTLNAAIDAGSPVTSELAGQVDDAVRTSVFEENVGGSTVPRIRVDKIATFTGLRIPKNANNDITDDLLSVVDSEIQGGSAGPAKVGNNSAHGGFISLKLRNQVLDNVMVSSASSTKNSTIQQRAVASYFDPVNATMITGRDLGNDTSVAFAVSENYFNQLLMVLYQTGLIGSEPINSVLKDVAGDLLPTLALAGLAETDNVTITANLGAVPYVAFNGTDSTIELVINNASATIVDTTAVIGGVNPTIAATLDVRAKLRLAIDSTTKLPKVSVNTGDLVVRVTNSSVNLNTQNLVCLTDACLSVLLRSSMATVIQRELDKLSAGTFPYQMQIGGITDFKANRVMDVLLDAMQVDSEGEYLLLKSSAAAGPIAGPVTPIFRLTLCNEKTGDCSNADAP